MSENAVPPQRPGSMSRRGLIMFGGSVALALAGCTVGQQQPVEHRHSATPVVPSPKPTPLPGTTDAGHTENDLAGFAAATLHRFGKGLPAGRRNLLTNLSDAHRAHARVLAAADPLAATTTGSPSPTPQPTATTPAVGRTLKDAFARLQALESKAARGYSRNALAPDGPQDQLGGLARLWGSLATASSCYADLCRAGSDPGTAAVGDQRANVEIPDPRGAERDLLAQCYAIIFGYQAAIAWLSPDRVLQATTGLAGFRNLRDQLADKLSAQHQQLPPASAAYELPVQPTNAAKAARLINIMEVRLLPYLGLWLATADDHDRKHALQTMITTARDALTWSPKIIIWPGYPTSG